MKFCPECYSYMVHSTTTGVLMFHCKCGNVIQAEPEDTLVFEEYVETASSSRKFTTFIENSPKDPSGLVVNKDCPNCGLDFMTQIRVGEQETVMFTCFCGARYSQLDLDASNVEGASEQGEKIEASLDNRSLDDLSFDELMQLIS